MVNAELLDNLRKAARNRENVVVDMTNLSRKSRNTKRCVFPPSYKKTANVYYTGLSTVRSRVGKRTDKYVPWSVVEEKMNSYSTPPVSYTHLDVYKRQLPYRAIVMISFSSC